MRVPLICCARGIRPGLGAGRQRGRPAACCGRAVAAHSPAPHRAIAIERAYIRASFDLQLRHHDTGLLDHPTAAYPEMRFIP
jgi:hypothetical protein